MKKTGDFGGLRYNPTLENEVVMLFAMLLPHLKDNFVIDQGDWGGFPDCTALRNGEQVGIEFELYSSNFERHKHHMDKNLFKCDIIVCWENNIPFVIKRDGKEFLNVKGHEIEIMSLGKEARSLGLIKCGERPGVLRSEEGFFRQLKSIKPANYDLILELYSQVKQNEDIVIMWSGGKRWSTMNFMVKKWKVIPIAVYGNGRAEISYQGNTSIFPWMELPNETKAELYQIFENPKRKPWHNIPLANRVDLNNINHAISVLARDSKRFSVVQHQKPQD